MIGSVTSITPRQANSIEFHRRFATVVVSIVAEIASTNTEGNTTGIQAGPSARDIAVNPPCTNSEAVIAVTESQIRRYDVSQATIETVVTMFAKMCTAQSNQVWNEENSGTVHP